MTLSISLPGDVEDRLKHLAAQTGHSPSFYITEAIRAHLSDLEELDLAEQRLLDIRAGRTQPVPLEDVMGRYGMDR